MTQRYTADLGLGPGLLGLRRPLLAWWWGEPKQVQLGQKELAGSEGSRPKSWGTWALWVLGSPLEMVGRGTSEVPPEAPFLGPVHKGACGCRVVRALGVAAHGVTGDGHRCARTVGLRVAQAARGTWGLGGQPPPHVTG